MAFDSSTPLPGAVVPDAAAADPDLPGPFAVGRWAEGFRDFLRERPRVLLIGEVVNLKRARASTYFELRDAEGAAPVRSGTTSSTGSSSPRARFATAPRS